MKATFTANHPNDIEYTATITMRLGDWIELRDALRRGGYHKEIHTAIDQMVDQARRVYWPHEDPEK